MYFLPRKNIIMLISAYSQLIQIIYGTSTRFKYYSKIIYYLPESRAVNADLAGTTKKKKKIYIIMKLSL